MPLTVTRTMLLEVASVNAAYLLLALWATLYHRFQKVPSIPNQRKGKARRGQGKYGSTCERSAFPSQLKFFPLFSVPNFVCQAMPKRSALTKRMLGPPKKKEDEKVHPVKSTAAKAEMFMPGLPVHVGEAAQSHCHGAFDKALLFG